MSDDGETNHVDGTSSEIVDKRAFPTDKQTKVGLKEKHPQKATKVKCKIHHTHPSNQSYSVSGFLNIFTWSRPGGRSYKKIPLKEVKNY